MSAEPVINFLLFSAGYFLPTIIAILRNHQSAAAISVLNLFLGWTVIGWIIALVWSLAEVRRQSL